MGDPAQVAYRLAPDQTVLVGPRILPFFWKCAAGVLFVHLAFTALWLRGFHTVMYLLPFRFAFTGSTTWMDIVFGAIANFGLVVLIFAAIQRWAMERLLISRASGILANWRRCRFHVPLRVRVWPSVSRWRSTC